MTVDTARLLARYNAHANSEMNKVLAALPAQDWTRDLGGYYASFKALVGHVYTTDIAWLVRFSGMRPFAALKDDPFDFPPAPGQIPFDSYAEYEQKRKRLDEILVQFAEDLTDADLAADLSYRNFRGEAITKNTGGLVLHMFNHQTHHRGMVALYLDQLDVPNDYNSLNVVV